MAALHGRDSRRGRTGAGRCVGERVAIGVVEEGREVSTATVFPLGTVWGGSEPTAAGSLFGTVTEKACRAENRSGSPALTVIRASPRATPPTVIR